MRMAMMAITTSNSIRVKPRRSLRSRRMGFPQSASDVLLCAVNARREGLVSTLMFLLGNRDDAQDAAQEAFLKCWRTRAGLPDVQNLRAWIFRVGLNTAKDLQRSAWHRRSRPLLGEENMLADRAAAPGQAIEDQEDLARL